MSNEVNAMNLMLKGLLSEMTDEQREKYEAHMVKFNTFLDDVKKDIAIGDDDNSGPAVIALTMASIEASKVSESIG